QLPDTQVLIVPSSNSVEFQNGYLGVDQTSSVDGEDADTYPRTISLVTAERDPFSEVQLASHAIELFNSLSTTTPGTSSSSNSRPPSISYFSIPLTNDLPQALRTPRSSISHQLIATLFPSDTNREALVTALNVDIRRYSSPTLSNPISPATYSITSPVRIDIEVPRIIYRLGDVIPVYLTIPIPTSSQILQQGFKLRNVVVELVRTTKLLLPHEQANSKESVSGSTKSPTAINYANPGPSNEQASSSTPLEDTKLATERGDNDNVQDEIPNFFKTVLTRTGAPARFHSSRPLRLRLLLQASSLPSSPAAPPTDTVNYSNGSSDCSITQHTTLHSVDFSLDVTISFLHHQAHGTGTEEPHPPQDSTSISVPITLLPPVVKNRQASEEVTMETAYHKKFDKPPTQTNRESDADIGPPGPSASGAPPPFDERDAPPPPFVHSDPQSAQAGTSRLPTFLESEAHYVVPMLATSSSSQVPYRAYHATESTFQSSRSSDVPESRERVLNIEGEGEIFGFKPEDQFDGLEASFGGSAEPPPAIDAVESDTNVTALADLVDQPEQALNAIGRGLGISAVVDTVYVGRRESEMDRLGHALQMEADEAPAPPFMDDPADPPPGIDMEYRTSPPPFQTSGPETDLIGAQIPPTDLPPSIEDIVLPPNSLPSEDISGQSARPPPYLNTPAQIDGQHRPPPYVDLRP
ncbi:4432_t:CDS:2, partial [Acaulospora colombiana]